MPRETGCARQSTLVSCCESWPATSSSTSSLTKRCSFGGGMVTPPRCATVVPPVRGGSGPEGPAPAGPAPAGPGVATATPVTTAGPMMPGPTHGGRLPGGRRPGRPSPPGLLTTTLVAFAFALGKRVPPSVGLIRTIELKRWKRGSLRKPELPIEPPILPMPPPRGGPTDMLLGRNCACDAVVAAATATTARAVEIDSKPINPERLFDERMGVPPRK